MKTEEIEKNTQLKDYNWVYYLVIQKSKWFQLQDVNAELGLNRK